MSKKYPIQLFVDSRLKELGFWRGELVKRCGYVNVSKGLRRLEKLYSGDFKCSSSRNLLHFLPIALKISEDKLITSIKATNAELDKEDAIRDAIWRSTFEPDAFILGSRSRPSQILAFGMTGGVERHLRIPLDLNASPDSFVEQALNFVLNKSEVEFFGPTTGFIINFSPDRTEQYDKVGNLLTTRSAYYYPGTVRMNIGPREIPQGIFEKYDVSQSFIK